MSLQRDFLASRQTSKFSNDIIEHKCHNWVYQYSTIVGNAEYIDELYMISGDMNITYPLPYCWTSNQL